VVWERKIENRANIRPEACLSIQVAGGLTREDERRAMLKVACLRSRFAVEGWDIKTSSSIHGVQKNGDHKEVRLATFCEGSVRVVIGKVRIDPLFQAPDPRPCLKRLALLSSGR